MGFTFVIPVLKRWGVWSIMLVLSLFFVQIFLWFNFQLFEVNLIIILCLLCFSSTNTKSEHCVKQIAENEKK